MITFLKLCFLSSEESSKAGSGACSDFLSTLPQLSLLFVLLSFHFIGNQLFSGKKTNKQASIYQLHFSAFGTSSNSQTRCFHAGSLAFGSPLFGFRFREPQQKWKHFWLCGEVIRKRVWIMEKSNKDCTIRERIDSCDASKYLRTLWKKPKTGCARWLSLENTALVFSFTGPRCMSVRSESLVRTQHMTSHQRLPRRGIPKVLLNVTDRTSVRFRQSHRKEELRSDDRSHPGEANPIMSPWSHNQASQEVYFLMFSCVLQNSKQSNHKCCRFHYVSLCIKLCAFQLS